jgi:transcription elongation factor
MIEYDIQLYWRRAKAWPGQYGEPDVAYARAAAHRLAAAANPATASSATNYTAPAYVGSASSAAVTKEA